jgi:DNA-binding MurR/RpiR family transcriptional regulator
MGIREVAKRASVSTATVSRVITGAAKVSPSTATRVMHAIQALDFQANEAARALADQKKLKRTLREKPKTGVGGTSRGSKILFSGRGSLTPKVNSVASTTIDRDGEGSSSQVGEIP